jgi:hypothetical protein
VTPETEIDFLTGYVQSLAEETRLESSGQRFGFDHIIYELSLADELVPVRLSFFRGDNNVSIPKKEPEHGIDQAFVSRDGKSLTVFVLKAATLTYANWISASFETDLRRARDQDLTAEDLSLVENAKIILAYNKDDNEKGVECWERFVSSSASKIGDKVTLSFQRWNLTSIVNNVHTKLLTPSLLPENFFKKFTYLCWQVGDFIHGSPQWHEVLLPDWREFLTTVLSEATHERNVRLISVALIVLRAHGKRTDDGAVHPSFETGWIELMEWAVLALWRAAVRADVREITNAVFEIWLKYYLVELERYYARHVDLLAAEHSLEYSGGMLQEGTSTYVAYWHLGRLGILSMATSELVPAKSKESEGTTQVQTLLARAADWIVTLLNQNPACSRPLLDIHHIQIFLVWRALAVCGRWVDALNWFYSMFQRLLFRRLGHAGCRIIDSDNSWESLFEYLATGEEPYAGFGRSSYLLLMIMEICLGAPELEDGHSGAELASVIHSQLILEKNGSGGKLPFKEHVELMGWIPPVDWPEKILEGQVTGGVSVPAHFSGEENELALPATLRRFVQNTRQRMSLQNVPRVPTSVLVLACLKFNSPLPSEFWRIQLFGPMSGEQPPPPPQSA